MKRKLACCSIIFIAGIILLPFIIDRLYIIGSNYPIVTLPYTESEMLSYMITVLAISISLIALYFVILQSDVKVTIRRVLSCTELDTEFKEGIEILNNNPFPLQINSFGMISENKINKKRLMCDFNPNTHNFPCEIKAYSRTRIDFDSKTLYSKIKDWGLSLKDNGYKYKKVIFYVRLDNNKVIEFYSKGDNIYLIPK